MTAKDTFKADPVEFVEKFSKQVEQWRKWHADWEKYSLLGSAVPGDGFVKLRDGFTIKLLNDLDGLFKTQEQVNAMMLAALDELRKDDVS